ncbi:MAG: zf-HC2 domain-containing protein [Bacteroidota bacterium]|nr:zf-HC2 domain-containing protein [Bacteroidota bacterium]
MNCDKVKFQLPDFVRGNLSNQDQVIVIEHIKKCESCRSEVDSLSEVIQVIQQENTWSPADNYWLSLLPRIHKRMEERSKLIMPKLLIKYAVPVMAAVAFIIITLEYLPTSFQISEQGSQLELTQLSQSELQDYMDQQSIVGVTENQLLINGTKVSEDDAAVLKDFAEEENYSLVNDLDYDSLLEVIGEQEELSIVSILEKKLKPS